MQQSLYQDETFANYWNDRVGTVGEAYKRYVLDALLFKLVDNFKDKVVLELGCDNGYLAPKFIDQSPKRVVMMDISEYNLRHAAAKCQDQRMEFLAQDATKPWKVRSASIDIVYSNMMLNEIKAIRTPVEEAFRVLRKKVNLYSLLSILPGIYLYSGKGWYSVG